jgi:phosphatidylserine/phosphatidylglycerophosphate/cardiolipin synthase-like enzyme
VTEPRDWFLTPRERGNPSSHLDDDHAGGAWTVGNVVEPLVHGATYFSRLADRLSELRRGDRVLVADWRGDHDELLRADGPQLSDALRELEARGTHVRALLWRSHPRLLGFNEEEERALATILNRTGSEVLLDERVRRGGSHHQKLVVLLRVSATDPDIAFVGGIDLCHGRRDDDRHRGDAQSELLDAVYGDRPPWHDVQAEVRGPAVADLAETFRERWNDPTPLDHGGWLPRFVRRRPAASPPDPLPAARRQAASGGHAVQVLRTYPRRRPPYPFAVQGERSIARLYRKALERARSFVYVEDQYFWSTNVANLYEAALRREPGLRIVVVVPRHPDRNGALSGPAERVGQHDMFERVRSAGRDRVALYDLENEAGTPVYVHAKVVIVDDVLAMIGSDNMNRRSWTHDSELSIAVLDDERDDRSPVDPGGRGDGARRFARDLRLRLWREHLGQTSDEGLLDPTEGFDRWRERASALDGWHRSGRRGPRPVGRVRAHAPERVAAWQRLWARPAYGLLIDPDGRPRELKRRNAF